MSSVSMCFIFVFWTPFFFFCRQITSTPILSSFWTKNLKKLVFNVEKMLLLLTTWILFYYFYDYHQIWWSPPRKCSSVYMASVFFFLANQLVSDESGVASIQSLNESREPTPLTTPVGVWQEHQLLFFRVDPLGLWRKQHLVIMSSYSFLFSCLLSTCFLFKILNFLFV